MPLSPRLKMLTLALGGLVTTVVIVLVVLYILRAWWSTPLFVFGASGPDQPIVFTHTVHVQEARIQCEFCHRNVTKGDAATVPALEQCMFCHKTIADPGNPEIVKLLEHAGLAFDPEGKPVAALAPRPIDWEKVHRVPDHVQFAHEPHIRFLTDPEGTEQVQLEVRMRAERENISLVRSACTVCHGNVAAMEKVKQTRSLKMGDCVDCHRDNDAPTDCVTCHY